MASPVLSQADAELFLHLAVRKHFPAWPGGPASVYDGVVTAVQRGQNGEWLWTVVYGDDDEEDFEYHELIPVLVTIGEAVAELVAKVAPVPPAAVSGGATSPQRRFFPKPDVPRYAGVQWSSESGRWKVLLCRHGKLGQRADVNVGMFPADQAVAAARAYDDAARQYGRTVVNFPVPGTEETQAVWKPCGKIEGSLPGAARLTPSRAARAAGEPAWAGLVPKQRALEPGCSVRSAAKHAACAAVAKPDFPVPTHVRRYNGVQWNSSTGRWRVQLQLPNSTLDLGEFEVDDAEAAARTWDAAARKHGRLSLNFPVSGTAEVQAQFWVRNPRREASVKAKPSWPVPHAVLGSPVPTRPQYLGVFWHGGNHRWRAQLKTMDKGVISLGAFVEPEAAARAYDAAARLQGQLKLNFPVPGTAEFMGRVAARGHKRKAPDATLHAASGLDGADDKQLPVSMQMLAAQPQPRTAGAASGRVVMPSWPVPALREVKAATAARDHPIPSCTRYVGVTWDRANGRWRAILSMSNVARHLGSFDADQYEAAARAYDAAARAHGRSTVNFPIPGSAETKAVFFQKAEYRRQKREAAAVTTVAASHPEAAAQPSAPKRVRPASPPAKPPASTPLMLTAAAHGAPGFPDDDAAFDTPPEPTEQRMRVVADPATADAPPSSPELDAFIRSIAPPLTQPDAVLRAMRSGHVQLAHVKRLARMLGDGAVSDLAVERTLQAAFTQWGMLVPGDQMALRCALASLTAEQLQ